MKDQYDFNQIEFLGSFPKWTGVPALGLPQFAFVGRSNVGKSSLVNMLVGRRGVAKVSGQPGKTQLINLFRVDERWVLVDLPGYGYARQSRSKRHAWQRMVREYLLQGRELMLTFVLIDSNIDPQAIDLEFVRWMGQNQVPFSLVFTKTDRLSKNQVNSHVRKIIEALMHDWEVLPPHFLVSAHTGAGRHELIDYIMKWVP